VVGLSWKSSLTPWLLTPWLAPGNFLPVEVDKRFVGREVLGVLLLGANPEVDFHSGRIGFASRKCALHRVPDLMRLWIARALHAHKVGRKVCVEYLILLALRGGSP